MKVVGIVAEYNPFHNGHAYQISYAKNQLHADYCIVVMSGDFTQRGTPAIFSKYHRAHQAILGGADVVIELPVLYATASAETFALGAVATLMATGIVDTILFGGETDQLNDLLQIADILTDEKTLYKDDLKQHLKKGDSFPVARAKAIKDPTMAQLLSTPNNILALEYLKSLKRLHSSITPVILKRQGEDYHSQELTVPFASATALRRYLETGPAPDTTDSILSQQIPPAVVPEMVKAIQQEEMIFTNDFSSSLYYALLQENDFSDFFDCNHEISNKILHNRHLFASFDSFCNLLKCKNMTYTRIQRVLCHILLHITQTDVTHITNQKDPATIAPYLHILGFHQNSTPVLNLMKKKAIVPFFTSPKDAGDILSSSAIQMLQKDIFAADLYRGVLSCKTKKLYPTEYSRKFIPIK